MLARIQPVIAPRDVTAASHQTCVERVIRNVRENPAHTFSLTEMAGIACMSPYHFNRVFRSVTGLPPRVFQCLLRVEAAKRMLLTTGMTITDVCFETGYTSIGTFTRRFAELVGVPPSRFRRLADAPPPAADSAGARPFGEPAFRAHAASIAGIVRVPASFVGRVYVGAFPGPIPRGRPAGCAVLATPVDTFRIDGLAGGRYHVAAAGIACDADTSASFLHEGVLRASRGPVTALRGVAVLAQPLLLRPASLTDAPILIPFGTMFDTGTGAAACAFEKA